MGAALVTGGSGFLGSAIVRALLSRDVRVRILALPDEPTENVDGLPVEIVRGDVRRPEDCRRAVTGVDTVFHAAAVYSAWVEDPLPTYEVNLRGSFNVLEAARREGVGKVIYTASIVALGRPKRGEIGDETTRYDAWDIDFPYSRSKLLSRWIAEDFARFGLDVRVICPGIVLGPGDLRPTPSGKLIVNALSGGPPLYFAGGASYVDVRDAAEVHVLASERGRPGETYLSTAHNLSNLQLVQAIDAAAGRKRRHLPLPIPIARRLVQAMERAAKKSGEEPLLTRTFFEYGVVPSFFDGGKAVRELGATYRPIDVTLRDAIAYFRERGLIA